MYGLIYLITNNINGMQYIGQTVKTLEARWNKHTQDAKAYRDNCRVHNAIRTYGEDNFSIESIYTCKSEEALNSAEIFYIAILNTKSPNGYNLTEGGGGASGYKHSEETKILLKVLRTGKKHSEETKKKISEITKGNKNPSFGKPCSEETKRKMSKALKGIAAWNKGLKGVQKSTRKGVPLPLETRLKISESAKRSWANGERRPRTN